MIYRIIVLLAFISQLQAQNLLKSKWKFKTGDDLSWTRHDFDDSEWKEITPGTNWEQQGYENYDGFAWYRTSVKIPVALKESATKNGGFVLYLAKIDDADQFYFNGELLGKTGEFPPDFIGKYDEARVYLVPTDKILWDKLNTLAVRVYDGKGGGGIYGEPVEFKVKGSADNLSIGLYFPNPNRIFLNIPEIKIPITIKNDGPQEMQGHQTLSVLSDFGKNVFSQSSKLNIPKKSLKQTVFNLGKLPAGFYHGYISFESPNGNKNKDFWFGIDPEKIVSPIDPQPDFENYWNRAKKELAAVDPQYKLTLVDSMSKGTRNMYIVEMRSLGNILVKGWYAVPKKPGKYPAILHLQGYGGFLKPDWMYEGDDMIAFGLNIRGHGFSKDNIDPWKTGPYILHSIEDKEMYIYRGAYMDTRRAVEFLFSRPEVDTSKVIVEGGSQGGALSIATAALNNNRIRLCVPHVPFLSDFRDYFVTANWPGNEFKEYLKVHPEANFEDIYKTLSYIDIKNLAPMVKCPTLMAIGLFDNVCPPHINFAAYNQLNVKKEYIAYPLAGHGVPLEYHKYKYIWIKNQLGIK